MKTHSRILAWKNPIHRGAWQATVQGVAKSQTWLSTHTIIITNCIHTYIHTYIHLHIDWIFHKWEFLKISFFNLKNLVFKIFSCGSVQIPHYSGCLENNTNRSLGWAFPSKRKEIKLHAKFSRSTFICSSENCLNQACSVPTQNFPVSSTQASARIHLGSPARLGKHQGRQKNRDLSLLALLRKQ